MPEIGKSAQTTNALVLRNETVQSANTSIRVYNLLKDLIDSALFFDQVVQIMGSSLTDVMSQKAVSDLIALAGGGQAIKETYADIPAMLADQGDQATGSWYRALDASADPLVTSGWAIYEYLGTTNGDLTDYYFILDQESLNITIQDATPTIKGIMKLYTSLGTNVDGTIDQNTLNTLFGGKQDTITDVVLGALIVGFTAKVTPVDGDYVVIADSADSNKAKKVTWANIKATLKTYFDSIYQAILTAANFGTFMTALTGKSTPVDADTFVLSDSADSNNAKKITWEELKSGTGHVIQVDENILTKRANLNFQDVEELDDSGDDTTHIFQIGRALMQYFLQTDSEQDIFMRDADITKIVKGDGIDTVKYNINGGAFSAALSFTGDTWTGSIDIAAGDKVIWRITYAVGYNHGSFIYQYTRL